jgi:hypothetical protein
MLWRLTVLLCAAASLPAGLLADEFKKVAFVSPYCVLAHFNDTSYEAASYFGQLDSCGINIERCLADSVSTQNSFGVRQWGQDGLMRVPDPLGGDSLDLINLTSWAVNMKGEAEGGEYSDIGYTVDAACGDYYLSGQQRVGWLCRAGVDTAGQALYFHSGDDTARFTVTSKHLQYGYLRTYARLKVWDVSSADTLCKITTAYTNVFGYPASNVLYVFPTDLSSVGSGQWGTISGSEFTVNTSVHNVTVAVDWYGIDSMAVDWVHVMSQRGRQMDLTSDASMDNSVTDYYQRIDTSGHFMFYAQCDIAYFVRQFHGYFKTLLSAS